MCLKIVKTLLLTQFICKRGKSHITQGKHKSFPVVFKSTFGQIASAVNFTTALRCFSLLLAPSQHFRLWLCLQVHSSHPQAGRALLLLPTFFLLQCGISMPVLEQALSVRNIMWLLETSGCCRSPGSPRRRKSVERGRAREGGSREQGFFYLCKPDTALKEKKINVLNSVLEF